MSVVTMRQSPPDLRRPVLVAAFRGWNDAGEAASVAVGSIRRLLEATTFAAIDGEEFFDFQVSRPTIRRDAGGQRKLSWPRNRFSWAELPGQDRHVVLLDGTEPNLRWRTFSAAVSELAHDLGIELVVTLGALQVDAPHTRPVRVTGTSSRPELSEQLALRRSTYEGPTGITGVLTLACADEGFDTVSLWAGVPHYLSSTRYLSGAVSLLERVGALLGTQFSLGRLREEAREQDEEIAALVEEDPELAEYVAELEAREEFGPLDLDEAEETAEDLVAELERYLRERGGD